MIEVFRTNITTANEAVQVLAVFADRYPQYQINFDLDDCDKVMRVQSQRTAINANAVCQLIDQLGHYAEVLPDEIPKLQIFGDSV